jgi:hypothetical protein
VAAEWRRAAGRSRGRRGRRHHHSEQRERILAHAATTAGAGSRLDGARWLGIFAGLFVVAGISLLIATNWEDIGPLARIGAFLALLVAVGEGAIRFRDRSLGLSVPLEVLWLFLPLLGIGLYGQTFQLSGDPLRPFLVWLLLTMPIAWLSPRPIVATIHTFAMAAVLFCGNFVIDPTTDAFLGPRSPIGRLALIDGADTPAAWLLSLVLLAAIAVQSVRLLPRAHRHHFVGIWAFWLMSVLSRIRRSGSSTKGGSSSPPSRCRRSARRAGAHGHELRRARDEPRRVARPRLCAHVHVARRRCGDRRGVDRRRGSRGGRGDGGAPRAIALPPPRLSPLGGWGRAAKALLVAPLVTGFAYLSTDLSIVWWAAVVMNLVLLAAAIGLMWHGSLAREVRQINLGVLVMVWLLITRFLDLFGSMLESGVGFIVAGVFLAGLSWALERTRRRLIAGPREAAT